MHRSLLVLCLALAALSGCGEQKPTLLTEQTAAKFDKFCVMDGLEPPKRATLVVIDSQSIVASQPETFRQTNPALFALVMGLGDPERAVETGATAPRERITIEIGDPVGAGVKQVFTGCVPGISQQELDGRKSAGDDGALKKYFGSDILSELQQARDEFRKNLLVALVQSKPGFKSGAPDTFEASALAKVVHGVGPGSTTDGTVRRLFIFTDPQRSIVKNFASYSEARGAGFAAGDQAEANLGESEVYVVSSGSASSSFDEAFLDAFFLRSSGDLKRVAAFSPDGLSPAPVRIFTYSGELPLSPQVKSPMDIRLAVAASGALVNSWISYSGSQGVRATPISGQYDCSDPDHCTLRGDPNNGLGQRWKTNQGDTPQPLSGGPFGGMRMIEAADNAGRLTGRIFDPIIFVGTSGDLKFEGKRVEQKEGATKR